jgi:hypothetical protein
VDQTSTVQPKPSRRKSTYRFDGRYGQSPATLAQAIALQLHAARDQFGGVNEMIGELMGADATTVYAWGRRGELGRYAWTAAGIEAVCRTTGGAHVLAFLARIGAEAPTVTGCHHAALRQLADRNRSLAGLVAQAADDLSPDDDTPGRFDPGELARLHAALAEESAGLTSLVLLVEKLLQEAA